MTRHIVNVTKVETYRVEVTKPTAVDISAALDSLPSGAVLTETTPSYAPSMAADQVPSKWLLTFEVRS
jgi:hypothetical protein